VDFTSRLRNCGTFTFFFLQKFSVFRIPVRATITPEMKENLILITNEGLELEDMKSNIS
jgi:hypothetical protein